MKLYHVPAVFFRHPFKACGAISSQIYMYISVCVCVVCSLIVLFHVAGIICTLSLSITWRLRYLTILSHEMKSMLPSFFFSHMLSHFSKYISPTVYPQSKVLINMLQSIRHNYSDGECICCVWYFDTQLFFPPG